MKSEPSQNKPELLAPSGRTHSLLLLLLPPPQVTEQAVHSDHSVQTGQTLELHF